MGQACFIDVQSHGSATCLRKNVPQSGVSGILDDRCAPLGQKKLSRQPKRVLRPHGDQDLRRIGSDPATRKNVPPDVVDEHRVVALIVIRRKCLEFLSAQGLQGAKSPILPVEQLGVRLPINEGKGKFLPVRGAENLIR